MNTPRAVLLAALLVPALAWSKPVMAESLYLYTGNDFTGVADAPYTSTDHISGGFDTTSPLAGNLIDEFITPDYFFFDDVVTSTSSGVASSSFEIWTTADGEIDHWDISIKLDSGRIINTVSDPLLAGLEGQFGGNYDDTFLNYNLPADRGGNAGDPGTWEDIPGSEPPPPAPVPEPGSLTLAATGLLGVVEAARRSTRVRI